MFGNYLLEKLIFSKLFQKITIQICIIINNEILDSFKKKNNEILDIKVILKNI